MEHHIISIYFYYAMPLLFAYYSFEFSAFDINFIMQHLESRELEELQMSRSHVWNGCKGLNDMHDFAYHLQKVKFGKFGIN